MMQMLGPPSEMVGVVVSMGGGDLSFKFKTLEIFSQGNNNFFMGLSLAQSSRKTRVQADPRNTQWANDTERFGHQQMLRMGWKPGRGLGSSVEGMRDHVKVKVKTDSKGLGHNQGQQDLPTGLDVFQRILGKLNGNEEEIEQQIQKKQQSGLYLQFVPGGVLEGTVKDKKQMKQDRKNAEKEKKKVERAAEKARRALKKAKKDEKAKESEEPKIEAKELGEPKEEAPSKSTESQNAPQARGIRATRNRYIAMKKKATADSQSLKEILML